MQNSASPYRFIGRISLMLMLTILLSDILPAISVHAAEGDFAWANASGAVAPGDNVFGNGISVDTSGNVYTIGEFWGTVDFDPGTDTVDLISKGRNDVVIRKLDSSGNFIWAKAFGGLLEVNGEGISVDISGNVYTMGTFEGIVDFDPGSDTFNLTSTGGSSNTFICKLDSSGNFIWAKAASANGYALGAGIAIDTSSNVYTIGTFKSTVDFDPAPAVIFNLISAGQEDIFISKLDSSGNFVWAISLGGSSIDFGYGIAVDPSGNIYTTGVFNAPLDFDPGPGTFNLTSSGMFISKLDSNGGFVWAKGLGATPAETGESITVDPSGNVYTTGNFNGTQDFDPGPDIVNLISSGSRDVFISKLDSSGDFVWAKALAGTSSKEGLAIAVDPSGNVYTTGNFAGTVDFDPGPGTYSLTTTASREIFINKLDSSGNFVWSKVLAGDDYGIGNDIAVDTSGSVYTTGFFSGTVDFDPGIDVFNLTTGMGGPNLFVSKLAGTGTPPEPGAVSTFHWPLFLPAIFNNAQP